MHEQKKYFRCKLCGKSYASKQNLDKHIKNVHDKAMIYTTYVGKLCYRVFKTKSKLKIHMSEKHKKPHVNYVKSLSSKTYKNCA